MISGVASSSEKRACGRFSDIACVCAGKRRGFGRLLFALLALGTGIARGADADLGQLMSKLAQRQHGHVPFVEKKFIAMLDRPLESSGELFYEAPDRLEKRTLKPRPESLVLEHGVLSATRGKRQYTLDLQQYPQVVPLIESIRATLAGDEAALERVFKVSFSGELARWQLDLTPSDPRAAGAVKSIRIEGESDAIHSVEILERDGDRSLLTIGPEIRG
ncbi:MAG TPA: LolA-related protein [Steroidobacteraceae bacterium]|nr:LolA-related protein [Steroidobacteraceae bacterium]